MGSTLSKDRNIFMKVIILQKGGRHQRLAVCLNLLPILHHYRRKSFRRHFPHCLRWDANLPLPRECCPD